MQELLENDLIAKFDWIPRLSQVYISIGGQRVPLTRHSCGTPWVVPTVQRVSAEVADINSDTEFSPAKQDESDSSTAEPRSTESSDVTSQQHSAATKGVGGESKPVGQVLSNHRAPESLNGEVVNFRLQLQHQQ